MTYNTFLAGSQIINERLQMQLILDLTYQRGFLSMPFHRVYFTDQSLKTELLPNSRFKIPIGIRANYFIGDRFILRSFYRFYHDDWGLTANTAELETVVKLNPLLSVSPFYRFYHQNGIHYFAPYVEHLLTDQYYSSNYDLSSFTSHYIGTGLRWMLLKKLIGLKQIELRYGHYFRTNSLQSDILSLQVKF